MTKEEKKALAIAVQDIGDSHCRVCFEDGAKFMSTIRPNLKHLILHLKGALPRLEQGIIEPNDIYFIKNFMIRYEWKADSIMEKMKGKK